MHGVINSLSKLTNTLGKKDKENVIMQMTRLNVIFI